MRFMLDTCFIIYLLEKGKEKKLHELSMKHDVILTSFNKEELEHITRKLPEIKDQLRRFYKESKIQIIQLPVSPGNSEKEKQYADSVDKKILQIVPDPSDAVMVAAAIKHKANILSRDKHHVFTTLLENELKEYGLKAYNELTHF